MARSPRFLLILGLLMPATIDAGEKKEALWSLRPVARPEVPTVSPGQSNPIDAFLASAQQALDVKPAGPADPRILLRRVTLDLTGLPPTPKEQDEFLRDPSPEAYARVVDRLLAGEQHGVRYGRHWLDVLRYADVEERMIAAPGIHLWRDWVINALNDDLPYDQFVRAQLTGQRSAVRTRISPTGNRSRIEPRPDDMFALGFLARGAVVRDGKDAGELPISAVETVSTAFMGMTVGCAKCHDHMYDPISRRDFYAMKALFDPLVLRKVTMATPAELAAAGRAAGAAEAERAAIEGPMERLIAPYRDRLYEERVALLPDDVRTIVRKPERERSAAEQKVADDYFPVLRIDSGNIEAIMPEGERKQYRELLDRLGKVDGGRQARALPAFWTVEVDPRKAEEPTYILTSGEPDRPEEDNRVESGWPFAPPGVEFREGRVEAFSDWLTAPENPLFARVAVNRLWQWHFGRGLHALASDFGNLGGSPSNPELLDWLASEFVRHGFRMKAMHRLIVTSEAYKRASEVDPAGSPSELASDPENETLWRFPLRRLEAEPIWDAIMSAAGTLDASLGGPSFEPGQGRRDGSVSRRAAYMVRGYSTSKDVLPTFLQAFDVDDGRVSCPERTRTVVAPQALFLMNSPEIQRAVGSLDARLRAEAGDDRGAAVDLAYRIVLARPPSPSEHERALALIAEDAEGFKALAWVLFNLDEFLYVR